MKRYLPLSFAASVACFLFLFLSVSTASRPVRGQEKQPPVPDRASLIAAAREIMLAQTYCALITIDQNGRPQVRTMNPFPPEEDLTVWIATNTNTRKVQQIRKDPRVCLYYADHSKATGYVALSGKAVLVDDMGEILKRKRDYWDQAFPGLKNLVLIKVIPEELDVLNYKRGALNDRVTWRTPTVKFGAELPRN
ncbi:MAG TPA: pyridoxamine 5'-phosphate oxidase family protein [Acidobacteriota bacterium]|nr:pyridoxamine 5'-phosphate oxidase family protein [Acidobacteriota bacterium]